MILQKLRQRVSLLDYYYHMVVLITVIIASSPNYSGVNVRHEAFSRFRHHIWSIRVPRLPQSTAFAWVSVIDEFSVLYQRGSELLLYTPRTRLKKVPSSLRVDPWKASSIGGYKNRHYKVPQLRWISMLLWPVAPRTGLSSWNRRNWRKYQSRFRSLTRMAISLSFSTFEWCWRRSSSVPHTMPVFLYCRWIRR